MAISANLKSVSNTIIYLHRETFLESPSPMKLQKLCYYAQGYSLASGSGELFPEDFQAWQHGPVIPELWQEYKHFGWQQIFGDVTAESPSDLLCEVVSAYGRYDGAALSTMTHRESPWIDARGGIPETDPSTATISKMSMQTFFGLKLTHGVQQS